MGLRAFDNITMTCHGRLRARPLKSAMRLLIETSCAVTRTLYIAIKHETNSLKTLNLQRKN